MGILAALITIGILVTVHEFGHFITAKKTGMRVNEFAIGFGPALWSKKIGETLYSLRCIPLGGYNDIAGMEPGEPPTADGFNTKSFLSRLLVITAGAGMNFLLPIVMYAIMSFLTGADTLVNEPLLGQVLENRPAYSAGLRVGDRILTINNQKMTTWDGVVLAVKENGEKTMQVTVERQGVQHSFNMTPKMNAELKRTIIGISPVIRHENCGIFKSLGIGIQRTFTTMVIMLTGLYGIICGTQPADLSGPIGVAMVAGEVAAKGPVALMHFIAFLSINLGILNLLPLPALDGGHVVLLLLEKLRGKPLPPKAMEYIQYTGISILIAITLFSTYKDLLRL